jgi:transcriptional regulator with XRE-family HTH domain
VHMLQAGHNLRGLREELGLTMRDVETATERIAAKHGNDEFLIVPSRLSEIETKGVVPSVYRLYSLTVIYRRELRELLSWYGVELDWVATDLELITPPRSHVSHALANLSNVQLPIRLDPSFDPRRTVNFGRMVEKWGFVPISHLAQLAALKLTYGYIGSEDWTMYPLIPPGSFVQVDETKNKVAEGHWRSEYERPIYFVETREGHTCCWCALSGENIILQPHPLSPTAARVLAYPQEAEVIGQVVGLAMKLGDWRAVEPAADSKAPEALN